MKIFVTCRQIATEPKSLKDGPFSITVCTIEKDDKMNVVHLPVQYKSRKKARKVARNVRRALDA